jgi:hypothetical protein
VSEHGGPRGEKGGFDWEGAEDLTAMSEGELKERLEALVVVEGRVVSYRRQVLQRRIDLIRAQLVRRGSVALSPEELARVLMGEEGRP